MYQRKAYMKKYWPIPYNLKGTQKLDKYIKELLSNNKKLSILN